MSRPAGCEGAVPEALEPGRSPAASPFPAEEQRAALTRVLAGEGRNALSRVELVASELARHAAPPAILERIETIRAAAGELDRVLGKIDGLASRRTARHWPPVRVCDVVERVSARLRPVLFARGAIFDLPDSDAARALTVEMPEATLERLIVGFLRLGLATAEEPGRFLCDLETEDAAVRVTIALPDSEGPGRPTSEVRKAQVEFELELVEWNAHCDWRAGALGPQLVMTLPIEAEHV